MLSYAGLFVLSFLAATVLPLTSEASLAALVAVRGQLVAPTDFRGAWQWEDLVDALNETLGFAKRRAVEPVHVDQSAYARFLPATIMAVTMRQLTISADLAFNNDLVLQEE